MTRPVVTVRPDDTVREVAEKMRALDLSCLPVCEGEKVLGAVSDRDLTLRLAAEGRDPERTLAREVMGEDILFCAEDEDIREAARLMVVRRVHRIFVVDRRDRLVGVVSLGDIAARRPEGLIGRTVRGISRRPRIARKTGRVRRRSGELPPWYEREEQERRAP